MIDIHSHILPCFDDGSDSVETSLTMLKECISQGVTDIILTPHYRGKCKVDADLLKDEFIKLKQIVLDSKININLYLGQEVFVEKDYKKLLSENKVLTLNDTKFVLIEFDYSTDKDVTEVVYELVRLGYKPIVAHVERYSNVTIDDVLEIKELGGLIQVNASSLMEKKLSSIHKRANKLLKNNLVDFIASDYHFGRSNNMLSASKYVAKKCGEEVKEKVFNINAKQIIEG